MLHAGLSLVVGLVLYISSINDEVMNRPREPEQFFNYHYGWSFAFAASSFLLKEVGVGRVCVRISISAVHLMLDGFGCCDQYSWGSEVKLQALGATLLINEVFSGCNAVFCEFFAHLPFYPATTSLSSSSAAPAAALRLLCRSRLFQPNCLLQFLL